MSSRRDFLVVAGGALGGALLGCGSPHKPVCSTASTGPGGKYCLVEPRVVRVPGAASLVAGQVVLYNIDDNTAAIVVRDAAGFYALSAVCTHQCCLVDVCTDGCVEVRTNPGDCAATPVTTVSTQPGASVFICPCHASGFGIDGAVLPDSVATRPLPSLSLRLDGADVVVDLGLVVSATVRVT